MKGFRPTKIGEGGGGDRFKFTYIKATIQYGQKVLVSQALF